MSAKLQQVHVRVNDAATGKPTPCRVRITDAEGKYYAPYGRTDTFPSYVFGWWCRIYVSGVLPEPSAYIDGTCEIQLPTGPLRVSIQKGPEYESIQQEIHLPPGKAALRFDLHRLINPVASGWYSGLLVQMPLGPHDMLLEGAAEGVQVVDLLAYERQTNRAGHERWYRPMGLPEDDKPATDSITGRPVQPFETLIDYPNLVAFSGQRACVSSEHCLVAVNTYNVHRVLGDLALLHCHRVVYPLRFGRSAWDPYDRPEKRKADNWTLADWCDQCHRKGGLAIGTHVRIAEPTYGGETLANLVLGKVDAITDWDDATWHLLLGLGLKVPRIGLLMSVRPISCRARTYVQLEPGQVLTYTNWIEAIRKGRTVVSYGPHLTMTVNGRALGEQVELDRPDAAVVVQARAQSRDRFDRIEILRDGTVVHTVDAKHDSVYTATTEVELKMPQSGWLAARCILLRDADPAPPIQAHTSPIYIRVGDQSPPVDGQSVDALLRCFERMTGWVERDAECDLDHDRQRLASVFAEARSRLQSLDCGQ